MNSSEDKKLDEMITKALGGTESQFDLEAFKDKHYDEIADFQRQAADKHKYPVRTTPNIKVFAKLAVAAMILIGIGIFIYDPGNNGPVDPPVPSGRPVSAMSLIKLNQAYNAGGLDEVEKQYEKAYAELGPRTNGESANSILNEL